MPQVRKKENRGLPARWVKKHGAFYYLPPADQRHQWDGKTWFRLGSTLPEAYKVWADRVQSPSRITRISDLLDRYQIEVVPKKSGKSQTENKRYLNSLRASFGGMYLEDLEPIDVYQYVDARSAKVAAKREIEVLSHAFTMAVQWGLIRVHPFIGQIRFEGEKPRDRYVEDHELAAALAIEPRRRKGSVRMIQAYLRLKLLVGLRQRDLLLMKTISIRDDGLHATPEKTKRSSGKRVIYTWTPELRQAIDDVLDSRPADSDYLFCNRYGDCLVDHEKGTAGDWGKMWNNFMKRVVEECKIERFTEHDLRAKVASDAENIEHARQLMSHADTRTTQRVYRRKPELVEPLSGALTKR